MCGFIKNQASGFRIRGTAMFQKIGDALRRFMAGRYGTDNLNRALLIAALVCILLGWLGGRFLASWLSVLNLLAYVPLGWCIFRVPQRGTLFHRYDRFNREIAEEFTWKTDITGAGRCR